ncbi:hypothetical protein AB2L27_14775 [Kineococcus sp. LSe6-4]|uniref:Uncharacterized protein n=1 Tax=Kineococcus halophytocola TaxID=3234027 RepID=A0ABV4H367_9ACTN
MERQALREQLAGDRPERSAPVVDLADLLHLQEATAAVHVADTVLDLAVRLCRAPRTGARTRLGALVRTRR